MSEPTGRLFFSLCRRIFRTFGPGEERTRIIIAERDKKLRRLETRYRKREEELKAQINSCAGSPEKCVVIAREMERVESNFRAAETRILDTPLKKAISYLGADAEPFEVRFAATFLSLLLLLIFMMCEMAAIIVSADTFGMMLGFLLTIIVPFIVYSIMLAYPEILARRYRVSSIAKTPEAINYMVMSMRISPSLNKAIEFAAGNTDEPMASSMRRVLWDVYNRRFNSIDESFLDCAYEFGKDNEDLKRALYSIHSATLERTDEGIARCLDKARDIALSGTRRRIREFVSTLSTPTTILFALGIIMPLMIGAMLPMMSMGSMNVSLGTGAVAGPEQSSSNPAGIIILMDAVFPSLAFLYAYHIVGKRPGTSSRITMTGSSKRSWPVLTATCCAALAFVGSGIWLTMHVGGIVGPLLVICGVIVPISFYCLAKSIQSRRSRREIAKMEDEFPDALFQLGSRIAEGYPVERALKLTSHSMKGTTISKLLDRISYLLQVRRTTPEEVIFGNSGALNDFPSKMIKASMRIVVEATKKDAVTAGQTIISISNYLGDMKKIEQDIRTSLRSSVDGMKATGMIFAPLVMGVTSALYSLLFNVFGQFGGAAQMLPPSAFVFIIGIYLVLMVFVITYFTTGIEHDRDPMERRHLLGVGLMVSVLVFSITALVGSATIGSF